MVSNTRPQVLYFTGPRCGICKAMSPFIHETADRYGDEVDLVEVDVAADGTLAAQYSIRGVPTLIAVKDGDIVDRAVGARTPHQLSKFFADAAEGNAAQLLLTPVERVFRLGAAAAVAAIAVAASQPLLFPAAAGLGVFAFWDLLPKRSTRQTS